MSSLCGRAYAVFFGTVCLSMSSFQGTLICLDYLGTNFAAVVYTSPTTPLHI